jgi:hypothetical protein
MGRGLGFSCFLFAAACAAQQSHPRVAITPRTDSYAKSAYHAPRISLDVKLVLIPVSVTDNMDRPVRGLRRENFQLKDEGAGQEIKTFSSEDAPVSVGLIFDASSSMHDKIKESRDAVDRFLDTGLPEDEFFLLRFNDRPEQLSSFTNYTGEIRSALRRVYATGWTALLDALYASHRAAGLALVGVLLWMTRRPYGAGLLVAAMATYPIPYYLTFAQPRYRHALEPIIMLAMGYVLVTIHRDIRAWVTRREAQAAESLPAEVNAPQEVG